MFRIRIFVLLNNHFFINHPFSDNNFDIPDRTFHSLQTTWRLSSRDSNTDVKELIPEFFYLSQMLCNNEGNFLNYNLGEKLCSLYFLLCF